MRLSVIITSRHLISLSIPVAYLNGSINVRVISGKCHGVESPVQPLGGCWYFHVTIKKAGDNLFQDIRELSPSSGEHGWTSFCSCWLDILYLQYAFPLKCGVVADLLLHQSGRAPSLLATMLPPLTAFTPLFCLTKTGRPV